MISSRLPRLQLPHEGLHAGASPAGTLRPSSPARSSHRPPRSFIVDGVDVQRSPGLFLHHADGILNHRSASAGRGNPSLRSPSSSMVVMVNCVVMTLSAPRDSGTNSSSGSEPITTPAAWMDVCLGKPFQAHGHVDQVLCHLIGFICLAQLRVMREGFFRW